MMFGDYLKFFRKEHYVNKLNLNESEAKRIEFLPCGLYLNTFRNTASHLFTIILF